MGTCSPLFGDYFVNSIFQTNIHEHFSFSMVQEQRKSKAAPLHLLDLMLSKVLTFTGLTLLYVQV
jgi:hypothetical protein